MFRFEADRMSTLASTFAPVSLIPIWNKDVAIGGLGASGLFPSFNRLSESLKPRVDRPARTQ
jgi:hypothetical protein